MIDSPKDAGAAWSPLTVIRPDDRPGVAKALVTESETKCRVALDPQALSEVIAGSDTEHAREITAWFGERGVLEDKQLSRDDAAAHWWERGWGSSLDYYLWSRNPSVRDSDDAAGDVRRSVVEGYREAGNLPARRMFGEAGVALPDPADLPDVTVGDVMVSRKSVRTYHERALRTDELSSILWNGMVHVRESRRADPNADALNLYLSCGAGLDFFMAIYNVDGLADGIYFYDVAEHELRPMMVGDVRDDIRATICGLANGPSTAALTVIMVSDVEQYAWRYRHERALRHLYMDAGRIAHDMLLVAGAYRVGVLVSPATDDRVVAELLGLDDIWQSPIYAITMGYDMRFMRSGANT